MHEFRPRTFSFQGNYTWDLVQRGAIALRRFEQGGHPRFALAFQDTIYGARSVL